MKTENNIVGVEYKELTTFADSRGFFREVIRANDPFFLHGFAQWSHSRMAKNTVKAWHYHHQQTDWWYCPIGVIEAVLYDNREESPTYGTKLVLTLGDREALGNREESESVQTVVVKIPPGVLHGCKVLSERADLFYITNNTYNPDDEGRYPFNSPIVGHPWGEERELIVTEKDRVDFVPHLTREPLA